MEKLLTWKFQSIDSPTPMKSETVLCVRDIIIFCKGPYIGFQSLKGLDGSEKELSAIASDLLK